MSILWDHNFQQFTKITKLHQESRGDQYQLQTIQYNTGTSIWSGIIPNDPAKSKVQYQNIFKQCVKCPCHNVLSKALSLHFCCYFLPTATKCPRIAIKMHEESSINAVSIVIDINNYHSKQVYSTCTHTWQPWSKTWYCDWVLGMTNTWSQFSKWMREEEVPFNTIYHTNTWYHINLIPRSQPSFPYHLQCRNVEMQKKPWNPSYTRKLHCQWFNTTKSNVSTCSLLPLLLERQ